MEVTSRKLKVTVAGDHCRAARRTTILDDHVLVKAMWTDEKGCCNVLCPDATTTALLFHNTHMLFTYVCYVSKVRLKRESCTALFCCTKHLRASFIILCFFYQSFPLSRTFPALRIFYALFSSVPGSKREKYIVFFNNKH